MLETLLRDSYKVDFAHSDACSVFLMNPSSQQLKLHLREAFTCRIMGWSDGGGGGDEVLRSKTNTELQRDIVHLSQISC